MSCSGFLFTSDQQQCHCEKVERRSNLRILDNRTALRSRQSQAPSRRLTSNSSKLHEMSICL